MGQARAWLIDASRLSILARKKSAGEKKETAFQCTINIVSLSSFSSPFLEDSLSTVALRFTEGRGEKQHRAFSCMIPE